MNLPVVIDIIIGLVFIYLTLSLLASEIQELIATVLQWRAEHLKRSIEMLIAGGTEGVEDELQLRKIGDFANSIYDNPIIKDLNQGAKGPFLEMCRNFTHSLGAFYRKITGRRNVFGDKSTGPSYIASENFAESVLDTLKIAPLMRSITESRLERFKNLQLAQIKTIADSLKLPESVQPIIEQEFGWLAVEFDRVVEDYQNNCGSLNSALDRMSEKLGFYINDSQVYLPETEVAGREFHRQMEFVKATLDSEVERETLRSQLQPSLSNVLNAIRKVRTSQDTVTEILEEKVGSPIYQQIAEIVESMPESLQNSLDILAQRAEVSSANTQEQLQKFQQEIQVWFDRSMQRAAGVYKRNARGVAILIGTAMAVAANADSINIINRLSKDSMLRSTVNAYAQQVVENNAANRQGNLTNLTRVQSEVDRALDNLALPFGWSEANKLPKPANRNQLLSALLVKVLGWIISGVAISMGAVFWFDVLSKVINIRNAGKKPPSSAE
ncbi:MAG: hypothetical protein MUE44_32590 [Oscillatoriaceae cyanobacterium Prado104]|jgi:hypothetical protein|nr:hypothetical protein [Oscillatoriaceae cyanobacterium Prado104]